MSGKLSDTQWVGNKANKVNKANKAYKNNNREWKAIKQFQVTHI